MTPPLPSPAAPEPHSQPASPPSGGAGGAARAPRVGDVYGRYTIQEIVPSRHRYVCAHVRCVCGRERTVHVADLREGRSSGCGSAACRMAHACSLPLPVRPRVETLPTVALRAPRGRVRALLYLPGPRGWGERVVDVFALGEIFRMIRRDASRGTSERIEQRLVIVRVPGEERTRLVALERFDPHVIGEHVAEQVRAMLAEVWA